MGRLHGGTESVWEAGRTGSWAESRPGFRILGAVDILDQTVLCCPTQSGIWSVASVLGDCDHNPLLSRVYQFKKVPADNSQLSPEGQDGPWLRFTESLVESERKTASRAQARAKRERGPTQAASRASELGGTQCIWRSKDEWACF